MLTQYRTKCPVQYVSTGVVSAGGSTCVYVYASSDCYPFGGFTGYNSAHVSAKTGQCKIGVNDTQLETDAMN